MVFGMTIALSDWVTQWDDAVNPAASTLPALACPGLVRPTGSRESASYG
jgi:hypothetical protein